jgi:hypothetical protein
MKISSSLWTVKDGLHKCVLSLRAKRGNPKTLMKQPLMDRHVASSTRLKAAPRDDKVLQTWFKRPLLNI